MRMEQQKRKKEDRRGITDLEFCWDGDEGGGKTCITALEVYGEGDEEGAAKTEQNR